MKTKIGIPFYSQHSLGIVQEWQHNCGPIVCVKMIVDLLSSRDFTPSVTDLIREGLALDGFADSEWDNQVIVTLLRNHGLVTYLQEFNCQCFDVGSNLFEDDEPSIIFRKGIEKVTRELLWSVPIIVEMNPTFNTTQRKQMIVLSGCVEDEVGLEGFFFHDPNEPSYWPHHFIELQRFKDFWSRRAIFFET